LKPGRNVWRVERANRAAVLIDGAAFFGALRRACLRAERRIFIAGWDIDSRTRLVDETGDADDGFSPVLSEFLSELVQCKPCLEVYLLLWDFSAIYAVEREPFPRLSLQWQTPPRVTLCMDGAVPFGSSQHQKLVVIDDSVAFSGGLDLTLRRWDCSNHAPDNPERIDPFGGSYPPFHDVQMMVDGPAAQALAELVRRRWCNACGTEPPVEPIGCPWPEDIRPDFENLNIGIARTQPEFGEQEPVHEVAALFLDSVDHAERYIYIENQFLTSMRFAERLAQRLRTCPSLEVLLVTPKSYASWVVERTLGAERNRFYRILKEAGGGRVQLVYPSVRQGDVIADTMVHSKVMVVADTLLRIGSANLNNRSMGTDTECDLVVEATRPEDRAAITQIRNRLIADHCGVTVSEVVRATGLGSFLLAINQLSRGGHSLCAIDVLPEADQLSEAMGALVDPRAPLTSTKKGSHLAALLSRGRLLALGSLAFVVLAVALAWSSPLVAQLASREYVESLLMPLVNSAWAPFWVIAIYVGAGLLAFPVLILIVGTAATFGPWLGFVYALLGVTVSALTTFAIGASIGQNAVRSALGSRWHKVRSAVDHRGVLALAAVRLVPVAPFSLINLIAGACSVSVFDYLAGTLLGMLPGLIAICALGHHLTLLTSEFSALNVGLVVLSGAAWLAVAYGAQALIGRMRGRAS